MQKPVNRPLERRQLLWNVLEPGDPYDIRKSMIAKMPGDKKPFMGDNIQMVCLFQAAEIERLIQYLDEYRLKYKEVERRELDRHFYEIQVKQLTEMCADSESLKVQVTKLKQYIRRLNEQKDDDKNKQDENLNKKYSEALQKLDIFHKENSDLKSKLLSVSSSIQNWKNRCQALEKSKAREIQEMRNSIQMQRRTQIDRQHRQQQLLKKFQVQRNQLQSEIRRLKEENNSKTMELQEFKIRVSEFNKESTFGAAQLEARNFDLENKIKKYIEQLDRLNLNIVQVANQRNQLYAKYQNVQSQIMRRDNQIHQYRRTISVHQGNISQLNRTIVELQTRANQLIQYQRIKEEYENRLVMMSQEINRLNSFSQIKVNEAQEVMSRYSRLEYQNQSLKNENTNLGSRLSQKDSATRTVGQLQQNLMRLTSQNRRLSDEASTVRQTMGEAERLKMENLELRRRLQQLQTEALHAVQQQRMNKGLEIQRFTKRQEENIRRINQLQIAFNSLRAARGDSRLNIELSDYKEKFSSVTNQNTQIKRNYQQQISYLDQENNNMKRQLDNLRRRIPGQHNTIPTEDILRLQSEIKDWERRSKEWLLEKEQMLRITSDQQRRSKAPSDWEIKSREYQSKIQSLTEELVGIRKDRPRDTEMYEVTINQMAEEIRRLQDKLRNKNQQIVNLQMRRGQNHPTEREIQRELQQYISKFQRSQSEILLLRQQIKQLSQNQELVNLRNQNSQLFADKQSLYMKLTNIKQQMLQFKESSINNSMYQQLQISLKNLQSENQQLKSKIRAIQQQNNRYINDTRAYQSSIKELKVENDNLKLRILELESQMSVDEEGGNQGTRQFKEIIANLQQNLHRLEFQKESLLNNRQTRNPRQLEEARRQIIILTKELETMKDQSMSSPNEAHLHQKILSLSNQIQKLNVRIRSKNEEVVNLDTKYKKVLTERTQIINMNESCIQNIQQLNREIRRLETMGDQEDTIIRQIQRLNGIIRTQLDQNTILNQRLRQFQQGNAVSGQLANQYQKLKLRYQEVVSKMATYEQRLSISSKEVQGLMNENTNLNNAVQRLINQINQYKKVQFAQGSQSERVLLAKKQNQRLMMTINQLSGKMKPLIEENQLLKRRVNQTTQRMQVQLKNHSNMYEQRIANIEQRYIVEQQRFNASIQQSDQLRRKIAQLSISERRISQYQIKINHLTAENRRIHEYQQKLTNLSHQIQQLRRQDQTQKFVMELNQYKQKYPVIQNQNQLLQRQILELSQKFQIQINNRLNIQKQLRTLNDENQKIKVIGGQQRIHEYESQITILKQEVSKYTLERGEMDRLRRIQIELANHLNESNRKILQLTQEIERLNVLLRQGKNPEINIQNLIQEIQRLNNSLRVKVSESTEWQNKFLFLENEAMVLKQDYQVLRTNLAQAGSQNEAYRKRIQEHQQKFMKLNGQFQKLSQIINELKRQNAALKQENYNLQMQKGSQDKNRILSSQIQRLTSLVQSLQQQIAQLRVRFVDQNALDKRIKEHLSLFVVLFAQIQSLRRRVKDKQKEVQQVRRSSLAPYMS